MAASVVHSDPESFVLKRDVVQRAIKHIQQAEFYPYFPAYLHLRQVAGREGRLTELKPNWGLMGLYLQVPDHPPDRPYFQPFGQGWLNQNLAGSWAGSSLRAGGAAFNVVEYDASTRTFTLKDRHWELARVQFMGDKPTDVIAVAAFLYRDYSITGAGAEPTAADLVTVFRDDFGYRNPEDDEEFNHLFTADAGEGAWADAFEALGTSSA